MALSQTTLYNELIDKLELFATEAAAIGGWATAFDNYWIEATTNGIPVTTDSTAAAKLAMKGGMTGLNDPGGGAAAIASGISTYWTTLNATPSAIFAACTAIAPPAGLSSLASQLTTTFTSNTTNAYSKEVSVNAIAAVIHAAQSGGQAIFPGPVTFTIL